MWHPPSGPEKRQIRCRRIGTLLEDKKQSVVDAMTKLTKEYASGSMDKDTLTAKKNELRGIGDHQKIQRERATEETASSKSQRRAKDSRGGAARVAEASQEESTGDA